MHKQENSAVFFLLLLTCFVPYCKSFAQTDACQSFLQREVIEKIKDYPTSELIPYCERIEQENKWGYMDKNSKKKLTVPFMNHPAMFSPSLYFFYKDCEVEISSSYQLKIKELQIMEEEYIEVENDRLTILDSANQFRGFTVDEDGYLTGYSRAYYKHAQDHLNISSPFKYQGQYWAIVENKKGNKIIINTKGERKPNIEYKLIKKSRYALNGLTLFYVEDASDKKGFITMDEKKHLFGKIMRYPFYSNTIFGYSLQHNGDRNSNDYYGSITKAGVLDLTTMQWFFKPKNGLKMIDIVYSSNSAIRTFAENREKANIYFVVLDKQERFLMGTKGNKYKVKRK